VGKMSFVERRKFHRGALEDQRHLLKTAIDGMAAGDLTQALHVATSIRVLVHETGRSKPLLKEFYNNFLITRSQCSSTGDFTSHWIAGSFSGVVRHCFTSRGACCI
jgi:hypothetical protein